LGIVGRGTARCAVVFRRLLKPAAAARDHGTLSDHRVAHGRSQNGGTIPDGQSRRHHVSDDVRLRAGREREQVPRDLIARRGHNHPCAECHRYGRHGNRSTAQHVEQGAGAQGDCRGNDVGLILAALNVDDGRRAGSERLEVIPHATSEQGDNGVRSGGECRSMDAPFENGRVPESYVQRAVNDSADRC